MFGRKNLLIKLLVFFIKWGIVFKKLPGIFRRRLWYWKVERRLNPQEKWKGVKALVRIVTAPYNSIREKTDYLFGPYEGQQTVDLSRGITASDIAYMSLLASHDIAEEPEKILTN